VQAQESPTTGNTGEDLVCSNGLPSYPDNTCPDGNPPQPSSTNVISESMSTQPFQSLPGGELSADEGQVSPEEIQLDTNGNGIVDEFESQNQAGATGGTLNVQPTQISTQTTPSQTMSLTECDPNGPLLKKGSKGANVKFLQNLLIKLGYDLSPYGADADFGSTTEKAVIKFQQDNSPNVDGVDGKVGPNTWKVLCGLVTPSGATQPPAQQTNKQQVQTTPLQNQKSTQCDPAKTQAVLSPVKRLSTGIWSLTYQVLNGQGLVLRNLFAGNEKQLDSISVPHFKIEYGEKSKIIRFCSDSISEPKISSEVNQKGKKYYKLSWGFTKVFTEPDLNGRLKINYDIIIRTDPITKCEFSSAECYRFIPMTSFSWTPPISTYACKEERTENCLLYEGIRIPEILDKFTTFYKLDYGNDAGLVLFRDRNWNLGAAFSMGPGEIQQTEKLFHAVIDGKQGDYDNIHNVHLKQKVVIPGCRNTYFDCLHMHWRWGDMTPTIDPLVDTIDDTSLPGSGVGTTTAELIDDARNSKEGQPYFVPGQTIDIAIVRDHSLNTLETSVGKAYEAFPIDPIPLVGGEPIASINEDEIKAFERDNQLPGVEAEIRLASSYHPVLWYIASIKDTDHAEFFRHGMFVLDNRLNK